MRPASLVAWRCASLKYAGTVITASLTGSPRKSCAVSRIFASTEAEISCGGQSLSPTFTQASPLLAWAIAKGATAAKRFTSSESKRRPIRRFTAKIVLPGFVTACRLATWPTSFSPCSVNATIDGVVRAPSEFAMTCGASPSMIATHEFVVPRSMPITLLIAAAPPPALSERRRLVHRLGFVGLRRRRHRHHHARRP